MNYEVIRHSTSTGFQRCGHIHRSKKTADECAEKLNKKRKHNLHAIWYAVPVPGLQMKIERKRR